MKQHTIMYKLEQILESSKVGILATLDKNGNPQMRWMTPAILKGRPGVLFAVTSPQFSKVIQLHTHPDVEWMIQTRALDQIVNLKGKINVLDNPSIKAEVMEAIAGKLTVFWNVNSDTTDFLVLETIIEQATYFQPMKGEKITVHLQ